MRLFHIPQLVERRTIVGKSIKTSLGCWFNPAQRDFKQKMLALFVNSGHICILQQHLGYKALRAFRSKTVFENVQNMNKFLIYGQ